MEKIFNPNKIADRKSRVKFRYEFLEEKGLKEKTTFGYLTYTKPLRRKVNNDDHWLIEMTKTTNHPKKFLFKGEKHILIILNLPFNVYVFP